jgi:acyl-CoA synthetase (AMP-forming)/AMP-acid ligase II
MTIFGSRTRTVAESVDRIARLAGALRAGGLAVGDRLGILSLNSDRYHELLAACAWSGVVAVPLNVRWTLAENAYAIADAGIGTLVVDDAFAATGRQLETRCPELRTVIDAGEQGAGQDGWLSYEALVDGAEPAEDERRGGDDLYAIFYTGGTTGEPKGVMLSHANLMASATNTLATYPVFMPEGRLLHAAPMFHMADVAAWMIGNLLGSTHVVVPAFEPNAVVRALIEHEVTDALLVPTMLQLLADHPAAQAADLSSVKGVMYGASPMSEAVLDRSTKLLPNASFAQAYGMTELAPVATLLRPVEHQDPVRRRSAGRATVGNEVRIVDPDDRELPRGEVGEIVVRGDQVMLGYWNKPEETAFALRGGFMHTGDAGYMDEDGYVFVVDRIKDMIVTGGENVYSVEVEKALAHHPAVASCAVIGIPSETYGEQVHAVVVLQPNARVDPTELTTFCRELIANYKIPRSIEFVEALPVSGAGKVLKRELRRTHWQDATRRVN